MDRPVSELRGLGTASARLLASVGIFRESDLRALGPVEAFARVRMAADPRVSLNLLYAMQAALLGIDWRQLAPEVRRALRDEALGQRPGRS
ncbi:TfoX/Sxy family DNA transformation protein [Phenylobacterium sp.]|jgi:DNA transformation protein|uniref:TfoX/Sxy family DNA transformation protein n=1 Tax=Phenylobacterium sp. TaxID=1871053 RepID=UPI0025FFEE71|nr:TfoX/Sxy family DNA transformation protein [Phenylobacterium sp.]MCA6286518.1 TfoX/Sxy family protein [Phenylobacterium sp.]MCA6289042.1 TfoX/Sxy family protein [Phenylobacterium sp.]MCA6310722.1 TfoX/Sxy family protein [Phenylobacterium sp.]MCA6323869.1 TfoX/Sxy family protein [Phenylobacterium sp.]MCA6336325.1 TfoX/Sxy family protein [Phenylobacterium sp.]